MIEDRLLMLKFRKGSVEALARIYEKYKNDLLKLAVILSNDAGAAEDIVQDVFSNFARLAPTIKHVKNLKGYLTVAVVNQVRNHIRDCKRKNTTTLDDSDEVVSKLQRPEQWVILSEQLKLLSRAMAGIPYEQREVITLYMQGHITFGRNTVRTARGDNFIYAGRYNLSADCKDSKYIHKYGSGPLQVRN